MKLIINIDGVKTTVNYTTTEEVIINSDLVDLAGWIINRVNEKVRKKGDRLVKDNTEYNPKRITAVKKKELLDGMTIETAQEKEARILTEFENL